jgi:hypothetical protein
MESESRVAGEDARSTLRFTVLSVIVVLVVCFLTGVIVLT